MNPPPRRIGRRTVLTSGAVVLAGAGALGWHRLRDTSYASELDAPTTAPERISTVGNMPYRRFGATGLDVSEVGFGSWALGGNAYGAVPRQDALDALARAEELGCNFVDTAAVYGDSEQVLGEFMRGRRDKWLIADKFSAQRAGMAATVDAQLKRLGTDVIDFYQLDGASTDQRLYDDLYALKKAGKIRFVGVSLTAPRDIDYVVDHQMVDGVQLPFNLLEPEPFLSRAVRLQQSGIAVIVHSSLEEGFLAGKFRRDTRFPDPNDQRHGWSRALIARTVDEVERLRFLESEAGSMVRAAVAYPLSFPQVSTVLVGTRSVAQATSNFGQIPGARLSNASIRRVHALQEQLDLGDLNSGRVVLRRLLGRY